MNARWVAAILAAMCVASPLFVRAQSGRTPTPAPGPSPSAAVTTSAKDWFHRLQTGNVDRTQFNAQMKAAFTDDQQKQITSQFKALGEPATFTFVDSRIIQGITVYRYSVTFKSGAPACAWFYSVDGDGKIAGLLLRLAQ